MANPFDQFDNVAVAPNPFDQFDEKQANPFDRFDQPGGASDADVRQFLNSPSTSTSGAEDKFLTGLEPSQTKEPGVLSTIEPAPTIVGGVQPQTMAESAMTPSIKVVPRMTPEEAGKWMRLAEPGVYDLLPKDISDRVAGIHENVISDTANFFTSPLGVATAGIAGLPSLAQKAISAVFLASTLKDAPERYEAIRDAKTPQERDQAIVGAIESAAVIGGTAFHVLDRARIASNVIAPTQPTAQTQAQAPPVPSISEMRSNAIADEVKDALPRLPGETQDRVNSILQKQASGAELDPSEQATLIQVRSYASKLQSEAGETNAFTGVAHETQKAVTAAGAKTEPPAPPTEPQVPSGEAVTPASSPVQGGTSRFFTKAQEEIAPLTEAAKTTTETQGMTQEEALAKAQDLAHKIATDVAGGDVRKYDAARDAALSNAMGSIKSSEEGAAKFNPDFMRKSAMEAAGKVGERIGPSLDEEEGRSAHETTPSEQLSPAEEASRGEYVSKAVATLGELDDRENDIVTRHTMNGETFEDIAKDHGISKQRAQQIHADALEKMRSKMEEDGYTGGPGAMGPKEALEMEAKLRDTSIKNSVVDQERAKRGLPPREGPVSRKWGSIWDQAMRLFDANENVGSNLVNELKSKIRPITDLEDAILTHEQMMRQEDYDRATEGVNNSTDPAEKAEYAAQLKTARDAVHEIYDIGTKAGTENARGLNARKIMVREDYSLSKMESRKRAENGGKELDEKTLADLKKAHDEIADLQKQLDESTSALQEGEAHAQMAKLIEREANAADKELAARPNIPKSVLEIARGIVDRWKTDADEAHKSLQSRLGHTLAGIPDPRIVLDVARIMRGKIGELGLKSAEISAQMIEEYGPKVKPFLKAAWKKAQELVESEKTTSAAKEVIKKGRVPAKEKTMVDHIAKAKAEKTAKKPLNPSTVGAIVREHIKAGIHGEDALMKATHKTAQEAYPDATERDVRNAFTDYGNAKYPSKEAVEAEARETRTLVRLQESINREKEGLAGKIDPKTGEPMAASRTGFQPDKATQSIREKQAQLNELLKKRQGAASPEQLASRDEAKQTALKNRIADLDKELRTGEKRPQGEPPPDSDKTAQLRAERDAMATKLKEIQDAAKPKPTPEEIAASEAQKGVDHASAAVDRWDRILKGELEPEKAPVRESKSNLEESLRAEADAMRKAAEEIRRSQTPKTDPEIARQKAQLASIEKSIAEYERRAKEMDFEPKGKRQGPDTEAVAKAKDARDAAKKVYDQLKDAQTPKKTPAEKYNQTQATRMKNRLAELEDKLARKDFTRTPKTTPPELNPENAKLRAKLERAKQKFEDGLAKDAANNRTASQKFWDRFVGVERAFKLSSDVVLAKLSMAALVREAGLTPAEEVVGGGLSKVLPKLAARAPREGGLSLAAEIKAKRQMFTKGMEDAWNNLQMKKSDLEVEYGSKKPKAPPEWYEYLGFLHAALKAPIKRAEFARSLEKRMLYAAKNGIDLNNPNTMLRLSQESYIDANRSIFMQDNVVSQGFSALTNTMENSKIAPNLGPAAARLARFLVPVVKVPTNMVGEVATGIHGLATGSVRAANAYLRGIDSLPEAQGDAIMRQLKKGIIGNALLITGYLAYKSIGGFYQKDDKRSASDVQPGRFRVGDVDIPSSAGHSTAAMLLNVGATLHRVEDERMKSGESKGIGQGVVAAGSGLVKELPFVPAVTNLTNLLESEQGFEKYIHDMVTSTTTPAISQHIAKVIDTPGTFPKNAFDPATRRVPQTIGQAVEMGVPGLRQNVPEKTTHVQKGTKAATGFKLHR